MPHANIWIRKENWDAWQKLSKPSEFVNMALQKDANPLLVLEREGKIKRLDDITNHGHELPTEPRVVPLEDVA